MFDGIAIEEMVKLLVETPEEPLQGVALIREHQPLPGQLFPRGLDRDVYINAMNQMMTYTRTCATFAQMLMKTPAQPSETPVEEYPL